MSERSLVRAYPCPQTSLHSMHNLSTISQIPPSRWPNHPSLLSPSVLVLMWTDMLLFAPALKLLAGAVSPADIWQSALWVPSWNLFDLLPASRDTPNLFYSACQSDLLGSLAIFLYNWSTSRSILVECDSGQFARWSRYSTAKVHLAWRRPQKCLPSIWKELGRTLISVLTGNPNGRVLFVASINRAPLTSFDVGGHLARRGLLWSLVRLIRDPGNRIITHWPTSKAPFSLLFGLT